MRSRVAMLACVVAACGVGVTAHASNMVRLANGAQVRSVSFRFVGPHEIPVGRLQERVSTRAPGTMDGLKRRFGWLPLVPEAEPFTFEPRRLQEDVARLRQFYHRQFFPQAEVQYDVKTDRAGRLVNVTFMIREGPPVRFRRIEVVEGDSLAAWGGDSTLAAEGRRAIEAINRKNAGLRFGEAELGQIRIGTIGWLGDHGYLRPTVEVSAVVDSAKELLDIRMRVEPGQRARFGPIELAGVRSVPRHIVTRNLPFQSGDWVSTSAIARGEQNLQSVELFRRTTVVLPDSLRGEPEVPVRVTVTESRPRFTGLQIGYVTAGAGVSAQGRWTHPNFTGGSRSLNFVCLVQTGWGSFGELPDRLARTTLTLRQPYIANPKLSVSVGPKLEWRDDNVERSTRTSGITTLLYQFDPLQSMALTYDFTIKNLLDLRVGGISLEQSGLSGLLSEDVLDQLLGPERTSQFIFTASRGKLDEISLPRHGLVLKPSLSATAPGAWSDLHFLRGDLLATAFFPVPLGTSALMLRASAGRMWPTGSSVPAPGDDGLVDFLALRDQTFTAGGSGDVRGYDTGLLGPKVPLLNDVKTGEPLTSDRYQPVGGLQRMTATAELRLPIPGMIRAFNVHAFFDAGRVRNSDSRFALKFITDDETRWFYTTGGGVGYYSPVGAIRIECGYQLDPSILDLRDPNDVLRALEQGLPPSAAPEQQNRRFRVHLSLGLWF